MKKYTYYLGLNDQSTKAQIVDTELAMVEVADFVMQDLGGWSISLVTWLFAHEDGTQIKENSIKIESLGFREESVFVAFAHRLKAFYNQESVLMEVIEVQAEFI